MGSAKSKLRVNTVPSIAKETMGDGRVAQDMNVAKFINQNINLKISIDSGENDKITMTERRKAINSNAQKQPNKFIKWGELPTILKGQDSALGKEIDQDDLQALRKNVMLLGERLTR